MSEGTGIRIDITAAYSCVMNIDTRRAEPNDIDAICDLLVDRLDEEDGPEARMVLESDGPHDWWVATVDGELASTMMVYPVPYRIGSVTVAGNQIEFVATYERFGGHGLVRRQFAAATEAMEKRGELISMIVGIPYFYRRFGYEYPVGVPDIQRIGSDIEIELDASLSVTQATAEDIPIIRRLQAEAQESADVASAFPRSVWKWLVESPNYRVLIARRAGVPVGMLRAYPDDDDVWVFEVAANDPLVVTTMLREARADGDLEVLHRPAAPSGPFIGSLGETVANTEAYYGRVLDLSGLLNALRPTFDDRLAEGGLDGLTHSWMLSTFVASYHAEIVNGSFGPVTKGQGIQAPVSQGGSGVPPDLVATMILGRDGITELNEWHGDVYLGDQAELMDALFPPQDVDVMSWVFP